MGDRGNIVIRNTNNNKHIFLYTHWTGYKMPERLQAALEKGQGRHDDEPYLARVIFQTLLDGDDSATGFGLTTFLTDNEYPLLVVDIDENRVGWCKVYSDEDLSQVDLQLSFDEFMKLDFSDKDACWKTLTGNEH